ncbi:alpha/beta hydrolase [Saccharicrinis aurantiacus]|uniref:alpha/beta hydrolase n=1 Tax=Saccharicrinis aurantiacus TaxID=1849719 RepID=UPI00249175B6|nr:alpha/beta hydrolase-fold protein [Saccharicrinis aurantiacus]
MKYLFFVLMALTFYKCTPPATSSRIDSIQDFSSEYVQDRNISVWLPEGYTSNKQYDVLYMHDGQMLFDSTKTWNGQEWEVDKTMQQLISDEIIKPTIVVGIWNISELRTIEYFPRKAYDLLSDSVKNVLSEERLAQAPLSDNYLKFIIEELKPYIDKTYSTNSGKESTFIAGSSMGGLISMYALCEYPDVFDAAACLSTHWPGTYFANEEIPKAFAAYMSNNLPSAETHKFYFDYGTETLDSLYEPYQLMIDSVLIKKGYSSENWVTKKFEGEAHKETDWAKRFNIPIEFIMKK